MHSHDLDTQRTADELQHALADLVRDGAPAISRFAGWALEHPGDIALFSLRELALRAQVNSNTVYRFAIALGYPGFDACRRNFQTAFVTPAESYSQRAQRLVDREDQGLIEGIRRTTMLNIDSVLSAEAEATIQEAARLMLSAKNVHCIGVRSSFALAHYLSYTGRMAFESFSRPIVEAGSILDVLSGADEDDVAVLVTFSLYSNELLRAHRVALERGMRIIAISDGFTSPIARGAQIVFTLPMQGPQTLPSFTAGFALVEAIVSEMITADPAAPRRIADFENRLATHGAYST